MAVLTPTTKVCIQGVTGKEGRRMLQAMREYGTDVVCGVTPGKGGEECDGVPVFDSICKAKQVFPDITASVISVPPFAARSAAVESIVHGIPLIHIFSERVPVRDSAYIIDMARKRKSRIIGPASVGVLVPNVGRLGLIGGPHPSEIYTSGHVGVVTCSGGMANEFAWMLRKEGLGQSMVLSVGGDMLPGMSLGEACLEFEKDEATDVIMVFAELGGRYAEEIAAYIRSGFLTKPIIMYIAGSFAESFPIGTTFGHAGAIVSHGIEGVAAKKALLSSLGVRVVDTLQEMPVLVRRFVRR